MIIYRTDSKMNEAEDGANDIDEGLNGDVTYRVDENEFFDIDPHDGKLFTKREFLEPEASVRLLPYPLKVEARDLSREGYRSNRTDCYVNLIRPINR